MASIARIRTFHIYTLSGSIGIFYVGQTIDMQARLWSHQSAARAENDQVIYQTINRLGHDFEMTAIDQITTAHESLALKLEACWVCEMNNRGCELANRWNTGRCVDHINPLKFANIVKRFADAPKVELKRLAEMEREIAYQLVWQTDIGDYYTKI